MVSGKLSIPISRKWVEEVMGPGKSLGPNPPWSSSPKELKSLSFLIREFQPPRKSSSLPSASMSPMVAVLSADGVVKVPITPLMSPMVADAQFHDSDKVDYTRYVLSALSVLNHASDVVEAELLDSNEAKIESACTTDSEKGLKQDFRLILQEHSGNIVKKWGNSEQWVLELRDRRRVAVPIQIPPPQCEAIEVLEE